MRSALLIAAVFLALMLGFLLGMIVTRLPGRTPVTIRDDDRSLIPVVQMQSVRDGELHGVINGTVRVFLGDQQILPGSGGLFHVPAEMFLVDTISIRIPEGMQFVASRRGRKYHRVDSSAAEKLAPENRVYFPSAGEAEAAGYVRGF